MTFQKAQRKNAKLRLAITGPAGSGKTYSSILIAQGLGGRIAMIDTENGSGDLYADIADYDTCTMQAPFDPRKYEQLIHDAEKAGYNTIIIDSLSHAWAGRGGILDLHAQVTQASKTGNSYTAWARVTPLHQGLVDAMLSSPCHIIATMRSKTDYIINENRQPVKVGLAPIQRDGMDYEFGTVFDLTATHLATVSKDRTGLFDETPFRISAETGKNLANWLNSGNNKGEKA